MEGEGRDYVAYMLRLWRVDETADQGSVGWRASLESPQTGEQFGFAGIADLFAFLEQELELVGGSCVDEQGIAHDQCGHLS